MASSPTALDGPHNHYNTEFVKLDASNWQENSDNLQSGASHFALLKEEEPLLDCQMASADSINNKSFTDVTFIVGPPQHSKKYVGHRVLLAMTSPVFETMFYGDMADKNKYIRIPDVAPIGFENLLRYAYTDSLILSSVEDAMLTAYAAKKYLLPQLLRECLTYIELNIGPSTACVVFEFAQVLNSQQLVLQAMNLIDRQTTSVISNKSFNSVQASTVEFVANRKYLNLSAGEYSLFSAVLNWSLAEAKRRQLANGHWSAIRSLLMDNSIMSAFRFLAMTPEEFARVVVKSSGISEVSSSTSEASAAKSKLDSNQTTDHLSDEVAKENQNSATLDLEEANSLLTDIEQRAILLNLALPNVAKIPPTINPSMQPRQPPPEYFTLKRFRSSSSGLITTATTTRNIKSVSGKFQCLNENVFIVALTIPIRLDATSYTNRVPKFECHLKFITKTGIAGGSLQSAAGTSSPSRNVSPVTGGQPDPSTLLDGSTMLMDSIDESLHVSITRDKDCLVRLKRPILIRMGNINELTLTLQTYALDEDIVALRTPKLRSGSFSEQTDGENISWLFFKTSNIEFNELHYYY